MHTDLCYDQRNNIILRVRNEENKNGAAVQNIDSAADQPNNEDRQLPSTNDDEEVRLKRMEGKKGNCKEREVYLRALRRLHDAHNVPVNHPDNKGIKWTVKRANGLAYLLRYRATL